MIFLGDTKYISVMSISCRSTYNTPTFTHTHTHTHTHTQEKRKKKRKQQQHTHTHTHTTRVRAHGNTHTHTRTHARTHERSHARTHVRTHALKNDSSIGHTSAWREQTKWMLVQFVSGFRWSVELGKHWYKPSQGCNDAGTEKEKGKATT